MSNKRVFNVKTPRTRIGFAGLAAAGLLGAVAFLGWVANEDATYSFGASDALATPSTSKSTSSDDSEAGSTTTSTTRSVDLVSVETRMRERRKTLVSADGPTEDRRPSEEEWRAAAAAMRSHMPNAIQRLESARPGTPARGRLMKALVDRFRELQRIQRRDPAQYQLEIEQTELEDQILGLARQHWRDSDGSATPELKSKIHDLIVKLVDLRIRNREAKLERLAASLANEQSRLDKEKADRDKVIDRQLSAVLGKRGEASGARKQGIGAAEFAAPVQALPTDSK